MNHKLINIFILSLIFILPLITNSYSQYKYEKTPHDMEGPYYPVDRRLDEDNNLINLKGKSKLAKGDVLYLTGVVIDKGNNSSNKSIDSLISSVGSICKKNMS